MKKKISVVALDSRAGEFYAMQVRELFGEAADVYSYSVQAGEVKNIVRSDLFFVSTDAFESTEELKETLPIDAQVVEIEVTNKVETINTLRAIPKGTKVLYVNLTFKMAREAITQLEQLRVNHLQFIPFYPGAVLNEKVDIAVTPDEERYVPEGISRVINIGQRPCCSGNMIEIAMRLGLEELLEKDKFKKYVIELVNGNYTFDQTFARSLRLESQFEILMDILDEGIIGVNEKGEIFACNEKARDITGIGSADINGRRIEDVFDYIPFRKCLTQKKTIPASVVRVKSTNVNVTVAPVLRRGECIGAFATLQRFADAENRQNELRSQLLQKGHSAKYSFDDVIGNSECIVKTREILKKMAFTESPVLLIGETGTGKELFAHAVHKASKRKNGPFIAINVAAMPENLLESELFGYEDGAFTGAKKGGKPGLFEFAHKGTLFLDEVEGMSPALQIKLLRVLQEREIMRVGGNRIVYVDVRIVAATNEYLEKKVEDGSFRRDLYYRLNTLPVLIPPLRERGNDIFLLLEEFERDAEGTFVISEEVKEILLHYKWPGNIRELHNVAEYFSFTGQDIITANDLPPTFLWNQQIEINRKNEIKNDISTDESSEYWFVLEQLYKAAEEERLIGRELILNAAKMEHFPLSQYEIRDILKKMADEGVAKVGRGRGGSRITRNGRTKWENYISKNQPIKP